MIPFKSVACAALLGALCSAASAGPALRYSFDTDAQGWTAVAGGQLSHMVAGKLHGGFLRITDVTDEDFLIVAPPEALGDWSAYLDGSLRFDARNANNDAPDWAPFGTVTLTNGIQTLTLDIAPDNQPPADGRWHHYRTTLSAAQWGPDLAAVLANLTGLTIKLEFHAGVTEVIDFDNVRVRPLRP